MEKKWVQHISGRGEKWEVRDCAYNSMEPPSDDICVMNPNPVKGISRYHFIPKSEYISCDPPEEWEDVTGGCTWTDSSYHEMYLRAANGDRIEANCLSPSSRKFLYRVCKIKLAELGNLGTTREAFIVERRKS